MPTVMPLRRLILNLSLAAICSPIIIVLWRAISIGVNLDHGYLDLVRSTFGGLMVYWLVSETAALLLGMPLFYLYRAMRITSWLLYGVGGALISLVVAAVLASTGTLYFFTGQPEKIRAWIDSAPLLVLCGVVSAIVFRAVLQPQYERRP